MFLRSSPSPTFYLPPPYAAETTLRVRALLCSPSFMTLPILTSELGVGCLWLCTLPHWSDDIHGLVLSPYLFCPLVASFLEFRWRSEKTPAYLVCCASFPCPPPLRVKAYCGVSTSLCLKRVPHGSRGPLVASCLPSPLTPSKRRRANYLPTRVVPAHVKTRIHPPVFVVCPMRYHRPPRGLLVVRVHLAVAPECHPGFRSARSLAFFPMSHSALEFAHPFVPGRPSLHSAGRQSFSVSLLSFF